MRRLFLLFVAFFATYYLWAQDVIFKSGDLYYTIRQMTYAPWEIAEVCTLPNPEGYSIYYNAAYHDLTEAIIPETVEHEGKTYPVTSIGYGAFHNSTRLKSVTIPSSVTMIWDEAFCRCDSLTTINIPNSVTDIGRMAFELCQSLTSLHIPEGVWQIGEGAFQGCWKLTDLTLPNSLKILGKGALNGCGFTSFTIPSGISTLSMGLFGSCMDLKSLVIPNNITTIESDVFVGCLGLSSIEIPNSVESLGGYAFSGCDNLETVILSEKLTVIEDGTFTNCPNIKNIYFNSTTPPSIGGSSTIDSSTPTCYIPCGTLEAYEASDWAEQVGSFVENCEAVVPDSTHCIFYTSTDGNIVEPRETDVFGANIVTNTYENGQGTITFDGPVTSIGERAFSQCRTLTTIILPTSVNNIGLQAFMFCEELKEISIPENVTTIGEGAFHFCQALTSVELSKSLNIIEKSAFQVCTALTSISVPDSVTFIGNRAFCNCQSLSLVTIGSGMTMIDEAAFMASPVANLHMKSVIPPTFIADSYPLFDSSPTCYIPCGTLEAYEASDWAQQVGEFVEECEAEQYTRDVTPNRYGTICLPFGSTDFSGATFYEIAYKAPFMIYFDEVTKLEAGKPYIFYAHSNKLIVTSDGSRVNNPLFDNGLYGTFDEIVAAAINILTNNYIVNNNTLCLCGEYCSLSANRAYVKLDEVSSTARALSPGRKRVSMSVQGENTTTALDNISEETESITIKEGVYDILGRKMSQPAGMGFYIIDGQKVIISQ